MRIIADFHIHSKYSRATSKEMDLEGLSKGAKIKGLNLIGTGDFTFPLWFKELKEKLEPFENGIFLFNNIYFILTAEVATYFSFEGKQKRIHHVIHAPSFEIVSQINEKLAKYGNLKADGRPILNLTSFELVEILKEIDEEIFIYPAHAWTPWMSIFGSKSGFNSIEECYQDKTKEIFAIETGLSSNPEMNWRLSSLDKFALISNSDSHSIWPWRLGREANVFELKKVSYKELHNAIKSKDKEKFLFTIETDPNYGKYHYTGHRNCGISLHPKDAIRLKNICPKCKRKLTVGVLQRVEELADRPEGFIPKDAIPFKTLLPLYEIISHVIGTGELYSKKALKEHDKLIENFGNELNVLLNASKEDLNKVTDEKIANAIIKAREGKIKYRAGSNGQYGIPIFNERFSKSAQKTLVEF